MAREFAKLEVSYFRRVIGMAVQVSMGIFLLYTVATLPSASIIWSILLTGLGFAFLWFAWRYWKSTETYLTLNENGLFDSTGRHFCTFDEIEKVDRSIFAFRPSAGFLIRLKTSRQKGWSPGLWWAFGKSVGVGGATSRAACKQMADIISVMISERGAEILAMDPDKD
ncbi:MAG: hypothetical protein JKY31_01510 [Rhodobacteraceae bacterium]|nr:hypothetical protein [Paracoccaceae bacterium]